MKATLSVELVDYEHSLRITVDLEHEDERLRKFWDIPRVVETSEQAMIVALALGQIAGTVHYKDFPPSGARG